jgi:hypothetical protein
MARAFHAFHDSHTSTTKFNTIHGMFNQLLMPVSRTTMLGNKYVVIASEDVKLIALTGSIEFGVGRRREG